MFINSAAVTQQLLKLRSGYEGCGSRDSGNSMNNTFVIASVLVVSSDLFKVIWKVVRTDI